MTVYASWNHLNKVALDVSKRHIRPYPGVSAKDALRFRRACRGECPVCGEPADASGFCCEGHRDRHLETMVEEVEDGNIQGL